jgi:hypothetical protein
MFNFEEASLSSRIAAGIHEIKGGVFYAAATTTGKHLLKFVILGKNDAIPVDLTKEMSRSVMFSDNKYSMGKLVRLYAGFLGLSTADATAQLNLINSKAPVKEGAAYVEFLASALNVSTATKFVRVVIIENERIANDGKVYTDIDFPLSDFAEPVNVAAMNTKLVYTESMNKRANAPAANTDKKPAVTTSLDFLK